jgi:hypothetical protein
MDTKYYIEKQKKSQKWAVEYQGDTHGGFDTKDEARDWGKRKYPGHGHEEERVQVRKNSPRGAKRGEWM